MQRWCQCWSLQQHPDPKDGRTLILPSNKDTHHDFLSCFKLTSSIANHNIHLLCNEYNHQTEATIFNKSNNQQAKLNIKVVPVQSLQMIHEETLGPPDTPYLLPGKSKSNWGEDWANELIGMVPEQNWGKEMFVLQLILKLFQWVKTFARGGKRHVVGGAGHVEGKPLDHSLRNEGPSLRVFYFSRSILHFIWWLGKPPCMKSAVFFNVQKAFDPPLPPCFRIGSAEDNFVIYIEYCFFFVPVKKLRRDYNILKQF